MLSKEDIAGGVICDIFSENVCTLSFNSFCLDQLRHCVSRSDKKAHTISRGIGISQVEYETS